LGNLVSPSESKVCESHSYITDFTEIAAPPKSTKSRKSNFSVQIQTKAQFEFVPQDTGKCEFLDLVDFRDMSCSVETVTVNIKSVTLSFINVKLGDFYIELVKVKSGNFDVIYLQKNST